MPSAFRDFGGWFLERPNARLCSNKSLTIRAHLIVLQIGPSFKTHAALLFNCQVPHDKNVSADCQLRNEEKIDRSGIGANILQRSREIPFSRTTWTVDASSNNNRMKALNLFRGQLAVIHRR